MQLVLLLVEDEVHPPPHALGAPGGPLLENFAHAHNPGHSSNQNIKVTADGVLQGGHLEELLHQLLRVHAALEVDGQLQAGQVALVAHIADLLDLVVLHQVGHLIKDGLHRGGVGDLVDLNEVLLLVVAPLGPDLQTAAARGIDLPQLVGVADQLAAGGEIGGQQGRGDVVVGVLEIGHGGVAHLAQVESADLGGHTHGDALVGADQHVGIGGGQQRRLLGGVVVVVHEVHGVAVQVPEQLRADGSQLCLGVTAGGVGHIPGVHLTEVTLTVHKGVQQGFVALGKAHHGFIDGLVAVGVEAHGLAHDIGGLGAPAGQKAHLIHGIEELSVGGLEAVDLRDGAGHDNAHGVGHIVAVQRFRNRLMDHLAVEAHHIGVDGVLGGQFRFFLSHCRTPP